jgi:hypothetical protein
MTCTRPSPPLRAVLLAGLPAILLLTLSALGRESTPAAPTGQNAPPDTGLAPPDSEVVLDFVNVDSLLLSGTGLLLAFEDTIPFAEGTLDTILVGAPRMKVSEVVRRIGERMARDRARLRDHSYTGSTRVVARYPEHPGKPRRWDTYESVTRERLGRDYTYQTARVWQRERKYEGDELEEEKIDDEVEMDWGQVSDAVTEAVPFALQSSDAYDYAILDRRLVGDHVVYKIHFAPRSSFQALPSGTVWVDFSDFVIRRIEAEMTGAVPMPIFLKSIPVFKVRREQKGEHWVVADLYARVLLRDLPLLKIPTDLELYYRTSRHVIDGVRYPDDGPNGEVAP